MLVLLFAAPAGLSEEAAHKALYSLHEKEAIGLVLYVSKPGSILASSWKEWMGKESVSLSVKKYGKAATKLATSLLLSRFRPDLALICPGQLAEQDAIARCLDVHMPVVLFDFQGEIKDTLTREALDKWLTTQSR